VGERADENDAMSFRVETSSILSFSGICIWAGDIRFDNSIRGHCKKPGVPSAQDCLSVCHVHTKSPDDVWCLASAKVLASLRLDLTASTFSLIRKSYTRTHRFPRLSVQRCHFSYEPIIDFVGNVHNLLLLCSFRPVKTRE
jgi:hypothetical protein